MKNNIENSIKESLKNFEAPYNSAAWTAMNSKLDAKMPTSSTGGTVKWIAAASVVVVALFASYFVFKSENNKEVKVQMAKETPENKENTIKTKNTNASAFDAPEQKENSTTVSATPVNTLNEINSEEVFIDQNTASNDAITTTTNSDNVIANEVNLGDNRIEGEEKTSISAPVIILPKLTSVCAGESFTIRNTNDAALELVGPSYNKMIASKSTIEVQLKNAGSYQLFAENSSLHSDFEVKTLPNVDFIIDRNNKFEKGLPTTKLISTAGNNLTWIINNVEFKGKEVNFHMFNRGAQNITLTEKGANGCSNSIKKQLFNEEKYNLIAMAAFRPNDIDPRNNTFMPFALTQREVKFTMIIIDPTDGHVVYQTSDSSRGWDGIDSKTGRLVKFERTYIWKVVLDNPERGENNEYAGNIIPITL